LRNDKENKSPTHRSPTRNFLPYRSIFAVLTTDSVLIYDTHHLKPLSVVRGLHFANIVDASWSSDGHSLIVCSTDCYISILRFSSGELGEVYVKQASDTAIAIQNNPTCTTLDHKSSVPLITNVAPDETLLSTSQLQLQKTSCSIPPCEAGPANILEGPPIKRQKIRITPTLVVPILNSNSTNLKRPLPDAPIDAVDKMTLNTQDKHVHFNEVHSSKKQKKRIQPILLAVANSADNN
jgi:hypothetical protein